MDFTFSAVFLAISSHEDLSKQISHHIRRSKVTTFEAKTSSNCCTERRCVSSSSGQLMDQAPRLRFRRVRRRLHVKAGAFLPRFRSNTDAQEPIEVSSLLLICPRHS